MSRKRLLASNMVRLLRNVIHRKYSTKRKIFIYVVKLYDQHFFHCRFLISLYNMSCIVEKYFLRSKTCQYFSPLLQEFQGKSSLPQ